MVCDVQELENAILNLVVNARDAMPSGGRLSVSLNFDDGPRQGGMMIAACPMLVVQISDTGCGIPAEILAKVFNPFFSTKPADRGTGLGLPMVAEFVRRARGSVRLRAAPARHYRHPQLASLLALNGSLHLKESAAR